MTIQYVKWLEITIHHDSFPEGKSAIFSLIPLLETQALLNANHILIKKESNVLLFFIGVEEGSYFDAKTFFKDAPDLQFQLIIEDISFYNYTDITITGASEILSFKNSANTQQLLPAENFEVTEHVKITEQISTNCLAIITLDCNTLFNDSVEEERLQLHFSAREVYVKYIILLLERLEVELTSIKITGLQNEVFVEARREQKELLIDLNTHPDFQNMVPGKEVTVFFISKQPIKAVFQPQSNRTLTIEKTEAPGRPAQKIRHTLPNADFSHLETYQTEGGINGYSTNVHVYI